MGFLSDLLAAHAWVLLPFTAGMSLSLCGLFIRPAHRIGLVDQPDARKVHDVATPLVGGLAIFLVMTATMLLSPWTLWDPGRFYVLLMSGAAAMLLIGLVDDLRRLSPTLRFLVQTAACLLLIRVTGVHLDDFGRLLSNDMLELGWLAVPITVFAAMGVINALNLIDGMDGLAGSICCVAALGMSLFAALTGHAGMLWLLLITLMAVGGFLLLNARLPWNPRARVFLGDAGSLMLGFVLAWSFIRLGNGPDRAFMPMTAVWLFAVPLLDTSTLIWTRWRSGHSAFAGDQRHLHHAFLRAGFSVGQAWVSITLLAVALGGIGILIEIGPVPEYLSFYAFMAFAFTYYFYVRHSWASQCFLGRHFIHHDFLIEDGFDYKPTRTVAKKATPWRTQQ